MRRALVMGNWKMNGSKAQLQALLSDLSSQTFSPTVDVAVCPVSVYLNLAVDALANSAIGVGAQNTATHTSGAYTGEVAAPMLADIGCRYAIVGHSERRAYYGESDAIVATKAQQCLDAGLTPVVCVGETLEQREQEQTLSVIASQLAAVFDALATADLSRIVIAYEPVWAIGTGLSATPEQAQEVHAHIRNLVRQQNDAAAATMPLLYGGSVNAKNAQALFAQTDIDGGLVGGASLKADEFGAIINSAA